jgi:entry exclusion lipoprotein TrbK
MNTNKFVILAIVGLLIAGCDMQAKQALPEANDANCKIDKVMQIRDESARRRFGDLCAQRIIDPNKAPQSLNWLEIHPK